jgi:hypothetical protein
LLAACSVEFLAGKVIDWYQVVLGSHFSVFFYSFCIIQGPGTIEYFAQVQSQDIQDNIKSRSNRIFLLMEEVFVFLFRFEHHLRNFLYKQH